MTDTDTDTDAGAPEAIFTADEAVGSLWIKSYQGEVLGEVLFARLAGQLDDPAHAALMRVLSTLEARTREAIAPALERAGISTEADPETVKGAEALADALATLSWADIMGSFEAVTTQYLAMYARIGELDPGESEAADLLVAHELALREVGRLEGAGHSDTSLDAVNALPHMR
jgi:hypothetical protein